MKYSIIVPVYNRPDEVDELLESLTEQTFKDMEVVIVEDGSTKPCESVVHKYAGKLQLRYYTKENSGPGPTRNFAAERSQGEFLIFLDSDCVLPPDFLKEVEAELNRQECDAWGGPDRAHESFTSVQKAISYSMTSFITTGGIRGGKKQMDKKFYPRSFNLGIRRSLYRQLGGFSSMRFGEDIDLSLRIYKSGASCRLFPEAWVWHKRRTDFKKFFKQVHNSGIARINLMKRHPGSLKLGASVAHAFHVRHICMSALCLRLHAAGLDRNDCYMEYAQARLRQWSDAFHHFRHRRNADIPLAPAALLGTRLHRQFHTQQEREDRHPFRLGKLHPAHRLRNRFHSCLVAAVHLRKERGFAGV